LADEFHLENKDDDNDQELQRLNQLKLEALRKSAMSVPSEPLLLSDANFQSEVSKHSIMVVDFWAPWCGPCRMVGPIIEQLAKEYSGKVTFGKLNVDESPRTSNQFQVRSIPTILIFKKGKAVDGIVGAVPKPVLEARLRPYLSEAQSFGAYV
jgi:thioredoxin 1